MAEAVPRGRPSRASPGATTPRPKRRNVRRSSMAARSGAGRRRSSTRSSSRDGQGGLLLRRLGPSQDLGDAAGRTGSSRPLRGARLRGAPRPLCRAAGPAAEDVAIRDRNCPDFLTRDMVSRQAVTTQGPNQPHFITMSQSRRPLRSETRDTPAFLGQARSTQSRGQIHIAGPVGSQRHRYRSP